MKQAIEQFLDSRHALIFAVLLTLVWGFWSVPLYDLDEGAFTEATREMMTSGNYTSIYLNSEPRHDKPILIYWLQAASAQVFGLNEFSLRLPSVLAGLAWVWALFAFARRHTDLRTARVAALILSLSLYVGVVAKGAVADALLNLFLALAMFDIFSYYKTPSRQLVLRVFTWMGLGFLTKGPVAVLFPVLVSGLFFFSYGYWRQWLKVAFDPLGILLFIAIVLPWHIAVYLDTGWAFFKGFYLHHNVTRFEMPMEGHGGGIFYYVLVAPLIVMPFAGWLINTFRHVGSLRDDPLDRYLWLWFFSVLLVFSFSGTKLPHYLLYGMSGLMLLMAKYRHSLPTALALLPGLFMLLFFALSPQFLAVAVEYAGRLYEETLFAIGTKVLSGMPQWIMLAMLLLGVGIAFMKLAVWRRLMLLGLLQALVVSLIVVPQVMQVIQGGVKAAALLAKERNADLVIYRVYQPSMSVYREQITQRVGLDELKPGQWVYVRVDHLQQFLDADVPYQREVIFSQGPANLVLIGG